MKTYKPVSKLWTSNELTVRFTWYPGDNLENFQPCTQAYGVCFNDEGNILIQREGDSDWCLSGGTIEEGEDPETTLRRELVEETDVKIKMPILLGGQLVEVISGHDPKLLKPLGSNYYQLRYYCEVDELLPQTPDPDNGNIHERKFVSPDEINKILNWGEPGDAIFEQAINVWRELHPEQSRE